MKVVCSKKQNQVLDTHKLSKMFDLPPLTVSWTVFANVVPRQLVQPQNIFSPHIKVTPPTSLVPTGDAHPLLHRGWDLGGELGATPTQSRPQVGSVAVTPSQSCTTFAPWSSVATGRSSSSHAAAVAAGQKLQHGQIHSAARRIGAAPSLFHA
jgi:hypothetical protein